MYIGVVSYTVTNPQHKFRNNITQMGCQSGVYLPLNYTSCFM